MNFFTSELKFYKEYYESHKSCNQQNSSDTLQKSGTGDCLNDEDCEISLENNACDCSNNTPNNCKDTSSDLVTTKPNKDDSFERKHLIPDEKVIARLWKRNRVKAKKLLLALNDSQDFSIKNGLCKIGEFELGCTITELLKISLQSHSTETIKHVEEYRHLLRKLDCLNLVTNRELIVNDQLPKTSFDKYWYYLG